MEEEEGFEPPRDLTPLSVFKTDPFSQTWVFLRIRQELIYHEPIMGVNSFTDFFQKNFKRCEIMALAGDFVFYSADQMLMIDFSQDNSYTSKCRARWEDSGVL